RGMATILLIHGAATTSSVWDRLLPYLDDHDVTAVERPRTGDLVAEVEWLAPYAENAWVVGVSGGATLGLALAASSVVMAGAVLHEPAVGSLLPELLAPMRAAFAAEGTHGFARALYGPTWTPAMAGGFGDDVTARELAMFGAFEPAAVRPGQGRVVVTVSADSPPIRHQSVAALADTWGYETTTLPNGGHFVQQDAPAAFADAILHVLR
ncbi:MAG: hypothetical protein JWP10_1161, partial [Nocardioidaceae bacterium]|nr:hypothetical protein [Nocardioidaceae bacterium]